MATSDLVTAAYLAIYRTPISPALATSTGAAIDAGTTSLSATINSYIAANIETTSPAIAELAYVDGVTPTSAKITTLATTFEPAQLAYYQAIGSSNPNLGPFEATGRAIAQTDPNFVAIGGPTITDSTFIQTQYLKIFGIAPSNGAAANFQLQINFFENLFTTGAGETPAQAQLEARGAVLGQMLGFSFLAPPAGSTPSLPAEVAAFETALANGTGVYGTPLPAAINPANQGVTITLPGTAADVVSPTSANTTFRSTAMNDLINGTLVQGASIDAGGGTDSLQVKLGTAITTTGAGSTTIANTEIFQINGNGNSIDVAGVTGATDFGSFKQTGSTEFLNISSAFNGKLEANTDNGMTTAFGFASTAPTADLTLTSDTGGFVAVGIMAGTGATSLAVHAATNTTNAFDLFDTTTMTLDGAGNTAFNLAFAPLLTSVNESAALGTESLTWDPAKSATITENNANDVFSSALTHQVLTTLNQGTGNDNVVESATSFTNASFNANGTLKTGLVVNGFTHGPDHVSVAAVAGGDTFIATTATQQGALNAFTTLQSAVAQADMNIAAGHSTVFTYITGGTTDTYILDHHAAGVDGLIKIAGLASYTIGTTAAGTADIFTS